MGPADLDRLCPDWRERETYISGPNEMLDAFTEHFERDGDCEGSRWSASSPSSVWEKAGKAREARSSS